MTNLMPPRPGDVVEQDEQIGQPDGRRPPVASLVAVDRLAEQRDFLQPSSASWRTSATISAAGRLCSGPADAGHDAVGAELVAAEHDAHHRLVRRGPHAAVRRGRQLDETLPERSRRLPAVRSRLTSDLRPAAGGDSFQQGRQLAQLARADDQIDVRGAVRKICCLILLGHAAQHADDLFPDARCLSAFKRPRAL